MNDIIWGTTIADNWLERNRDQIGMSDPISEVIEKLNINPTAVLDVGCSNGWRLNKLKGKYGCVTAGVDPSERGIQEAANSGLDNMHVGTASFLPFVDNSFDMVIFGFSLVFISANEWLKIAAESTRVLKDGGHIIIHDFSYVYAHKMVFQIAYKSDDETRKEHPIYMYYFNWPQLWTVHPGCRLVYEKMIRDKVEAVTVIRKDFANAFDKCEMSVK